LAHAFRGCDDSIVKRDEGVRLSWLGKTCVFDPAETREAPRLFRAEQGVIAVGDNRASLVAMMPELRGRVTLAYMDPPFLTNRAFDAVVRGPARARAKTFAFDDRWSSRGEYLSALGQRLVLVRETLALHGSAIVHVDSKTSHYVKVLCDEIFGEDAFASEIIWRYRRWPSKTPNFQRVHDVLLRYRKDPKTPPRWNQPYEPLAASTLATWGTNKQRAIFEEGGRRARSSTTDEATKGVPMGDVWEIGVIAPVSRERTGYPSQKPEALLARLIEALSDPGELVLDPYAGSGTTLAVAARLGRSFVGMDASDVAIATVRKRLRAAGIELVEPPPASEEKLRSA
jgi:hypothetical protein